MGRHWALPGVSRFRHNGISAGVAIWRDPIVVRSMHEARNFPYVTLPSNNRSHSAVPQQCQRNRQ
jgi:hypothetical protein